MTSRQHTVVATLLVILGLYVMRLTTVEIQPTPEGLIAVQAERIVLFDDWSIRSLPTLASWTSAIGVQAIGASPLAVRWFSLLCVVVASFMTYLVARRSLNFENAVLAMGVVAISTPFVTYGRQATDVIPFIACMMLTLWGVVSVRSKNSVPATIGAASALALGIPGAVLSSPISAFFAVDLSIGTATAFDGVGALIQASPLLATALLWCVVAVFNRQFLPTRSQVDLVILTVWFVGGMLLMVVLPSRSDLNVAYVIAPAVILSLRAIEQFRESRRIGLVIALYGVVTLASVWYILDSLLHVPRTQMVALSIAAVAGAIGLASLVIMRSHKKRAIVAVRLYTPVIYGAIAVTAVGAALLVMKGSPLAVTGGRAVASAMHEDTLAVHSFTYLYHAGQSADAFNGQLAWYTNGWMTGWKPGYRYLTASMPASHVDESVVGSARGASWIVYYHPGIAPFEQKRVRRVLIGEYSAHVETPDYTLYRNR